MAKTSIEWTGYSWNPLRGVKGKWHCTKVSPGCEHCYAERVNHRFGGPKYTVGADLFRLDENVLQQPRRWRGSLMIFVCSMTDLFHEDLPFDFIARVLDVCHDCPNHTFQILTKRPENAKRMTAAYGKSRPWGWPLANVWLGVSCEDQQRADERIPILLQIPAAVRWVSAEPMLGPVDLASRWMGVSTLGESESEIDWVVCGGESGPGARPFDPEWGRDLLRQCKAAGVPFFGKQWDKKRELPDDLMVREMPDVVRVGRISVE